MLKKLIAIDLDMDGKGVCKDDNTIYFIENLLVGEEVLIDVSSCNKNICFLKAELKDIIKKSIYRKPDYAFQSQANLIHLNDIEQVKFQYNLTKNTFLKFNLDVSNLQETIFNNNFYNYRNKITLFSNIVNKSYTNFFQIKKDSYLLEEYKISYLSNMYTNNFIIDFNNYLKNNKIIIENLNQLIIRNNEENEFMLIFVVNKDFKFDLNNLENFFINYNVISIYKSISNNKLISENNVLIRGEKYITYNINGLKYFVLPSSFFQVNTSIINDMYNLIKSNLSSSDIVFDCFSGISSISQYISDKVKKIYSLEMNKDSNIASKKSIDYNNIKNIQLIEADFFKVYKNFITKANTLILDPPRKGITKEICNIINQYENIEKIIYLSCNLKTLVRDLQSFNNYSILKIYPIRNFFQTSENETLVILKKNNK